MNLFDEILKEHKRLLERRERTAARTIKSYMDKTQAAGVSISSSNEREQLRAILRYWASKYYDLTREFPDTELAPFSGEVSIRERSKRLLSQYRQVIPIVLITTLFLLLIYSSALNLRSTPNPTNIPATLATTPTLPSPTPTPVPTIVTETPEIGGINVNITSPSEGSVPPDFMISGSYENLQSGWTIHILVQPLSEGGAFFPLDRFYTIEEGAESGQWSIPVTLDPIVGIDEQDQVNLIAVVANVELARIALTENANTAIKILPEGLIGFDQVITVNKAAYIRLSGELLLVNVFREGQLDLAAADYSEAIFFEITATDGKDEFHPTISPDGTQFAYIEKIESNGVNQWRLIVVDNQGRRNIIYTSDNQLLSPAWSQDGTKLAFNFKTIGSDGDPFTGLFIYSFGQEETEDNPFQISSNTSLVHPDWLSSDEIIVAKLISAQGTGQKTWGLIAININTLEERVVHDTEDEEEFPNVSPTDPNLIVYTARFASTTKQDIFVYDIGIEVPTQLTDDGASSNPSWDDSGRLVFYDTINLGGGLEVWVIEMDNGRDRLVLNSSFVASKPEAGTINTYFRID